MLYGHTSHTPLQYMLEIYYVKIYNYLLYIFNIYNFKIFIKNRKLHYVFLYSVNRDGDNILDKIYQKQIYS